MKCSAQITASGDPDKLNDCLAAESKDFDRSSFRVTKTEWGITIDIDSKDPTALRATLNSITQLLTVYDKMEQVK